MQPVKGLIICGVNFAPSRYSPSSLALTTKCGGVDAGSRMEA